MWIKCMQIRPKTDKTLIAFLIYDHQPVCLWFLGRNGAGGECNSCESALSCMQRIAGESLRSAALSHRFCTSRSLSADRPAIRRLWKASRTAAVESTVSMLVAFQLTRFV